MTKLVVIVPVQNEEAVLATFLESLEGQTRLPDRLVLVDDGSSDASPDIVDQFAADHPYAVARHRARRPPERDRLLMAEVWRAFLWAVDRELDEQSEAPDIVVKLDADLRLVPETFAAVEQRFEERPTLGITGPYLSVVRSGGKVVREPCPPFHVRGATKFYRWRCYQEISPVPAVLGWDTIDEVTARMRGWETGSFAAPGGDPLLLRPTSSRDGVLRGFRRGGRAAYSYGAHPFRVALGGVSRVRRRPYVLGAAHYLFGWVQAVVRRPPSAPPEVRAFARREEMRRLRHLRR